MITLDVKEYCHDCSEFHPEVITFYGDSKAVVKDVVCTNRERCAAICNYICKAAKNGKLEGGENQ